MMSQTAHLEKISKQLYQLSEKVLVRELDWIKQNERIQFYEPNEPITKLVQMAGAKNNLVNIAGNIMFGPQNSYFKYPLFESWPYPKRLRFVSEPSQVKESGPFPTEIERWWPKGTYTVQKDGQHYASIYKYKDWILEVMTYEQSPKQHEGANLGCVMFNEPPPQTLWTPNISRLRSGGIAFVGMTPLTEAGWFFEEVVPRHEEFIVYADVETACKTHGTRGHLDHDVIDKMVAEYSPEEREARVDGKAMYLKGLIYKMFNSQVHVLKETFSPPQGGTIIQSVDPHSDKPFACVWTYVDPKGDLYIIDEWPNVEFNGWKNCQLTIRDYAKIFREKENGIRIHRRIIDRHFADVRSAVNKRTLREELRDDVGLDFDASYQASEEVETGILKVREYLKYNPDRPIDVLNKPKLFINPTCFNTIRSFQKWARDPKPDTHGFNKPSDAYKDFMDCVRYVVMSKPEPYIPIPYEPAKKMW